jgi:hypothetical protein
LAAKPASNRLRLVEALVGVVVTTSQTSASSGACGFRFVIEIGRASGLFRGNPPKANTLISKKHGGSSQQELPKLKNWIKPPALEEKNSSAEQADRREEHVVITGESGLETAHEVEHCSTYRQHNANNAGPIQTGINHSEAL